jgi:hypothetical protein
MPSGATQPGRDDLQSGFGDRNRRSVSGLIPIAYRSVLVLDLAERPDEPCSLKATHDLLGNPRLKAECAAEPVHIGLLRWVHRERILQRERDKGLHLHRLQGSLTENVSRLEHGPSQSHGSQ